MTFAQLFAIGLTLVLQFMAPDAGVIIVRGSSICVAAGGQLKTSCYSPTVKKDIAASEVAAMFAAPQQ